MRILPNDVYRRCVSVAKSYRALKKRCTEQEEMILYGSSHNDGMPHGTGVGNPTAQKAERLAMLHDRNAEKTRAIESALRRMQDDTERKIVEKSFFDGVRLCHINLPASERTMKRVRSKFIVYLAEELGEF